MMLMGLLIKTVESQQESEAVQSLRIVVFVTEQGVPLTIEIDEEDVNAIHAIAFWDGSIIGTGRLIIDTLSEARIGRMAVKMPGRRQGIGSAILRFLEHVAVLRGINFITLHAQEYVKQFYTEAGYIQHGDTFREAGILHVEMTKEIYLSVIKGEIDNHENRCE
ncbi:GNAT family N-acetyltransferase [SAR202 cluster bacterium AD-802-E10_MRT_200m]|nr:GNAT family N-acetyltransferase [SAR202 cluster bacterium AD-802-E10_MRT_200m]